MMRAVWNGAVLAESHRTVRLEGNYYFPIESVEQQYLRPSSTHTVCPWKGRASYYTVVVDGEQNRDAVWHYPNPSLAAEEIRDHVAFWRGVRVEPSEGEAPPGLLSRLRRAMTG